jgi:hypothetical protein
LGSQSFDIKFERCGEDTMFDVVHGRKDRIAIRPMQEWAKLLHGSL